MVVDIQMPAPSNKTAFLSNKHSKQKFLDLLISLCLPFVHAMYKCDTISALYSIEKIKHETSTVNTEMEI
jgi:hypothetical protein